MSISNKEFWSYWKKGQYDDALHCAVEEEKKSGPRLQTMLFGTTEQMKQTGAITSVSAGEFIYDYVMINPTVVEGVDFARADDLSSLFTLSQFSGAIDTTVRTGDMAQLQGYVAEQMVAAELEAKGHDVEFPGASNQPGYDLIVDGQPFQVKSLQDPDGVREHLETYPDIPVYVNEELAPHFEGNPNVYVSSVSQEEVYAATSSTLDHSDDLLDFEIPWISAGISTIYNIKRVFKDDVVINQAVVNVVSDTSSRVVLGALGQKTGILVGTLLFGPAGGITGAMVGAYAGAGQGGRLSNSVRRMLSKKQENEMNSATVTLIEKVVDVTYEKETIKQRKMADIENRFKDTEANASILKEVKQRFQGEVNYLVNKREELLEFASSFSDGSVYVLDVLPNVMAVISKSGVHPVHFQEEMEAVGECSRELVKRL
ncbi:hypothetical protein LCM20_16775 [Halobacillus litoralis]|uniref:hypothetical protein n=1 Tax=Halobacillus litoralis TaxID=45668 RepID=UPI001CD76C86|nr:hypothetical protein [Halobacillus litoralis]MCA0972265.1 hypothetical protein [Halobacillus litoralis]